VAPIGGARRRGDDVVWRVRSRGGRASDDQGVGRGYDDGGGTPGGEDRMLRCRRSVARHVEDPLATPPTLHVSRHPAILHKLAILRDERTEPKKFREVVRELSWLLGYEALADARVRPLTIRTPLEEIEASELDDRIGLVPILRAGLGMVDAMLELMPTAQVWHLGLFRDERTLRPVEYYNRLPDSATVDLCLILDPMLATGGSATAAIEVLKRWGAVRIKLVNLIAAPEGVQAVTDAHPDVHIYCAALDRQLNEKGYILPGLGDAGDRQFGTGRTD
jgi:uracil phosphoribosyltransferase